MNDPLDQRMFSTEDIRQIKKDELSVQRLLEQLALFRVGTLPVSLDRPCMVDDGIVAIDEKDIPGLIATYDENMQQGRVLKFVPASGAASRMFKEWFSYLDKGINDSEERKKVFAANLMKHAFIEDLTAAIHQHGESLETIISEKRYREILDFILTDKGINYGSLPKALMKFHAYPNETRTALEEHLIEGVMYTKDLNRTCRIHFTVSEEHEKCVMDFIEKIKESYESRYDAILDVTVSTQKFSTNTISVDMENQPFRDDSGRIVFRPGGHGALIENLNDIDGDIIFLKNIDNVAPDRLKPLIVRYKKVLGGYLIGIQKEIFNFLRLLDSKNVDDDLIRDIFAFCSEKLYVDFPSDFHRLSLSEKCDFLFANLNRPIRVCGMVKNEGEPGGGPFWVNTMGEKKTSSLQIVEAAQIDSTSEEQKTIWSGATHFNPVDLVCGVRNYKSQKFDLRNFVDEKTYFISKKSEKGRELKALEVPGLWNGAMADWNTIFIEVPIETFNPVKVVDDLLRPQHRTMEM
jgi:hypothetical protein